MRVSRTLAAITCWLMAGLFWEIASAPTAAAQNATGTQRTARTTRSVSSVKKLNFSGGKAVIGLPANYTTEGKSVCTRSGATFLNVSVSSTEGAALPDLYSISTTAEVKRIPRKLPVGFDGVALVDFYANDNTLLSLIKAWKRDGERVAPRDESFFLSTSDYDGDHADLVELDLRFEARKAALLNSGHFLVLGWDKANMAQVMANLKADGTLYRILDAQQPKPAGAGVEPTYSSLREANASDASRTGQKLVGAAAFVPYGNRILMTQAGTTAPIRVFGEFDEDKPSIPLPIPSGYLLQQLIYSGPYGPWVFRVRPTEEFELFERKHILTNPREKVFEVSLGGGPARELTFDQPRPAAVTCAATGKLTAIFYEDVANVDAASSPPNIDGSAKAAENTTQLVISTVPR